jgi:uncharacterized linocin/CFP29 family protein
VEPAASISGAGALSGGVTRRLMANGFQASALQPYIGSDGRTYITVMEAGKPVAREITANALLRRDEWRDLDRTVVQVATERLNLVADLRSRGLVRNLGGLGTLMAEYERTGDMGPANVDMSGVTRSDEDTISFDLDGVPVPIIHKGFRINIRRLEASRRLGQGLDVVQGEVAGRKVAEKLEDLFFNGSPIRVQGRGIFGMTNHPNRNTVALTDWTDPATRQPVQDVLKMIAAATAAGYYGPFMLYLPANFWTAMLEDYKPESDRTLLDRLRGIEGILDVKASDRLQPGNVVMPQFTSDVIQLGEALGITPVDWEEIGGMEQHFKVMTAAVPIFRITQSGKSGITHGVAA